MRVSVLLEAGVCHELSAFPTFLSSQNFVIDCSPDLVPSVLSFMHEMELTDEYTALVFSHPDFSLV